MDKWTTLLPVGAEESRPSGANARRVHFGRSGATSVSQQFFDTLAEDLLGRYLETDPRTYHSLWIAFERVRAELAARGSVSELQSHHLRDCLARDLIHLAALAVRGPRRTLMEAHRIAAGDRGALACLLQVLDAVGDGIYRLSSDSRSSAIRRSGDLTCAGTIACPECKRIIRSRRSVIVEPCTGCGGRTLHKSL